MHSTLIIAHPYTGSFNHVLLETVKTCLLESGKQVEVIDLYQDGFRPELNVDDLRVYNRGMIVDPMVVRYQAILKETDDLVLVFPIWWYEAPAIMKGFIDKVMTPGFAFKETPEGLIGQLGHIKRLSVITTSEVETTFMRNEVGNPIEISLMKTTLGICGIKEDMMWLNCEHIASGTLEERVHFIGLVEKRFKCET